MRTRVCGILGGLLLLLAVFLIVWRGSSDCQRIISPDRREVMRSARSSGDNAGPRPRESQGSVEGLPVLGWEIALRQAKSRNRLELEERLTLLDERVGLSDTQRLSLRHHMENWYASLEREWAARGHFFSPHLELEYRYLPMKWKLAETWRSTWTDHREIAWSAISGSILVSDDQRPEWRELSRDLKRQRDRNMRLAGELLSALKAKTGLEPHQEMILLSFLADYQVAEQGWGVANGKEAPWSKGLRAGRFDPVCEFLDEEQRRELVRVISERQ